MKRVNFLTILVLILSMNCFGQWTNGEYVDDFGEKTGETYKYLSVVGTFSNSATIDSDCGYVLKDDGETLTIGVYPYNRENKESWIESVYQTANIKTPSGKIVEIETFCYKKGSLYYSKENYKKIKEVLSEKGKYIYILNYSNKYSEAKYKIRFTL